MWTSNATIMLWGAGDNKVPVKMFQYLTAGNATIGAIASTFGSLLVSSTDGSTKYYLEKENNYSIAASYKTIALNLSNSREEVAIDMIKVKTEQIESGGKLDINLVYNQGKTTKALTQIAYAASNPTVHKILSKGVTLEDFRLEFD